MRNVVEKSRKRIRTTRPDTLIDSRLMRKLVYQHLHGLDTPRALSIYLIMRNTDESGGFDDEICSFTTDPLSYNDSEDFRKDYEATELVRKWTGLRVSWDPEVAAWEKFQKAESECAATNRRLRSGTDEDASLSKYIERMRHHLSSLLGTVDTSLLDKCVSTGGWGKGVTSSCKGKWLTEYHKLVAKPQATQLFATLADVIYNDDLVPVYPPYARREIDVVTGSTLQFVPKDARAHRSIAVEPSMNLYLQRGIGQSIATKLRRRWNLNLQSQTRNQRLARLGSLDNSYATIDLSSASDTISYALVERILPPDWFALMNSVRCSFTTYKGENLFLNKWSSMGNGYTFELETAIFAAAVRSVISENAWYNNEWAVYGDDIIVPTCDAQEVCRLLLYLGFSLNTKKTFLDGPFRESCGADFFLGRPVRPFYLKKQNGIQLTIWANWLKDQCCPRQRRTWDLISWALGPTYPRLPTGNHGLVGLELDHWTGGLPDLVTRVSQGRVGTIVEGFRWKPEELRSHDLSHRAAIPAHLRYLTARYSNEPSDAWLLAARESGRWERRKSLLVS